MVKIIWLLLKERRLYKELSRITDMPTVCHFIFGLAGAVLSGIALRAGAPALLSGNTLVGLTDLDPIAILVEAALRSGKAPKSVDDRLRAKTKVMFGCDTAAEPPSGLLSSIHRSVRVRKHVHQAGRHCLSGSDFGCSTSDFESAGEA